MLISEEYREVLRRTREHVKPWGTTGHKWADTIRELLHDEPYTDILDYGSGSGSIAEALHEYEVTEYDPGIVGKEDGNEPRNFVVCLDVLEHIEPELLDSVLNDLQRCVIDKGFFIIACRKAKKILADGRNAHLIVETPRWWSKRIKKHFEVLEEEFLGNADIYKVLVRTKGLASEY